METIVNLFKNMFVVIVFMIIGIAIHPALGLVAFLLWMFGPVFAQGCRVAGALFTILFGFCLVVALNSGFVFGIIVFSIMTVIGAIMWAIGEAQENAAQ